jgi:rRNA maturation RNase YbeY
MMRSESRPLGIANRQRKARPRRADIRLLLDRILDQEGEPRGVNVVFVGERTIRRLNRIWMEEDAPTDVLSFPLGEPPPGIPASAVPVGEIVVCVPVCERAARERRVRLSEEIARMLIHGTLHVLGYDHATARQIARMRPLERRHLAWCRRQGLQVVAGA